MLLGNENLQYIFGEKLAGSISVIKKLLQNLSEIESLFSDYYIEVCIVDIVKKSNFNRFSKSQALHNAKLLQPLLKKETDSDGFALLVICIIINNLNQRLSSKQFVSR